MTSTVKWTAARLSYPVLCLARDTSISVAEAPDRLERCNARAFFTNRYFDDLLVVDVNAGLFRVVASHLQTPPTGLRYWLTRLRNASVTVRLQLEQVNPPSIEAAKQQVVIWLEMSPDFWEASRDLEEWKRLVRDARDMRQVVDLFA